MSDWERAIVISGADSNEFAALSGDFNPMHLDAVAARRTRYGGTVVHGIHLVLKTLDELASLGVLDHGEPGLVDVKFKNPVRTDSRVTVRRAAARGDGRIHVTGSCDGRTAFSLALERGGPMQAPTFALEDREFEPRAPMSVSFPPPEPAGTVAQRFSRARAAALFPHLMRSFSSAWIADLLATTQIVGMRCPGLDSIYSTLRLSRIEAHSDAPGGSMQYLIERTDDRFRMVRIRVVGTALAGHVEAFFRPPSVEQCRLVGVLGMVPDNAFSGHRVLVVGGGRGLGEVAAKIALAGGADVTLTYSKGRNDAERIAAEASTTGRACTVQQLDVTAPTVPDWLARTTFSHVYYFASPAITRNTARWDHFLFEQFATMYVRSFATLAEGLIAASANEGRTGPRFLYPSSVFLDRYEKGFAEYCAAKAAGEALCEQLQQRHGTVFAKPRLPRMRTDQTSGLPASAAEDPLPVMLRIVREFHS